jgi:hypothetical protein
MDVHRNGGRLIPAAFKFAATLHRVETLVPLESPQKSPMNGGAKDDPIYTLASGVRIEISGLSVRYGELRRY